MENVKLAFPSYYHFSFSCKILKLNGSDYREVFLAYYIQHNFTSLFPSSIFNYDPTPILSLYCCIGNYARI